MNPSQCTEEKRKEKRRKRKKEKEKEKEKQKNHSIQRIRIPAGKHDEST